MAARRPRVAQVIPWLSLGGATGLLIQLTERLLQDGYEVEIVTGPTTEAGVSMGHLAERLGCPIHVLPSFYRAPNPWNDVRALMALTELFRRGRFDIVHGHGTKGFLLGAWAARRANVQATVWHVHGWGFHDYSSPLSRALIVWLHRKLKRTASRIVAVSEATKMDGLRWQIGTEEDYTVIYEAVDLDRFSRRPLAAEEAKRRLGIEPNHPVVGSITRLAEQKCPLDLVDAFHLLLKRMPRVRLLLVGHGPLWKATEARIAQLGIADAVMMLGARWDIPEILAATDVFALTSLWEGFPICYLEAMAMGVPVVGTDAGGARECILDGHTGFLVPRRRPDLVADRLYTLLSDDALRQRMGEAGRRHAAQFGYDRLVADIRNLYAELTNGLALPVVADGGLTSSRQT